LRTEEEVEILYKTYVKSCGKERERYEAGFDPYHYGRVFGAAFALGLTLNKSMREIQRDIDRTEKRYARQD
jgi:hypothetical protein